MTEKSRMDAPHHFGGGNTRFLLIFVQSEAGPAGVEEMLRRAGETRSAEELTDVGTWSSYDQFRSLMAAAREVLGGREKLAQVSSVAQSAGALPELISMLQGLGSPDRVYAEIGRLSAVMSPIVHVEPTSVAPGEWVTEMSFVEGFEPFKDYCVFSTGLLSEIPRMFGMQAAQIVEEACQCDGDPICRFRIRWEHVESAEAHDRYEDSRIELLEAQLESLQATVADLVSGADVEEVLHRIVAAASRAMPAPGYLLAVEALPLIPPRVYAEGMELVEVEQIAEALKTGDVESDNTRMVVEVASQRHHYGYLAAISNDGQLFEQAQEILEPYGRLAAAALDSAVTLEDTRHQAATATALLELSSALSEIVSTDEMAGKLARAVPRVIDCNQALVVLIDRETSMAHVAGSHGFSTELESRFLSGRAPVDVGTDISDTSAVTAMGIRVVGELLNDVPTLAPTETLATVPIVTSTDLIGWIAASVNSDPAGVQHNLALGERLRGLAAQAATAMANTYLVDQIRHQAFHDALTGLPNRMLILDRIEQAISRSDRNQSQAAVLLIDLDNFKDVNDSLGHAAGDELLQAVASRLALTLRSSETIGRLGGDELVVLTEITTSDAGPAFVAERLLEVLREPFHLDESEGMPLTVTASIGISVSGQGAASELMRDADVALYQAKAAGKNCYIEFHPEMHAAVRDRLAMEMDLREALAFKQFFLVYQPIFDLQKRLLTGAEALLRWRHPTRGIVSPDDFIPALEENGLIVDVGRWVLEEACRQAAIWHEAGYSIDISVNASARQFETNRFVEDVSSVLDSTGLHPSSLVIEITETTIMRDAEAAALRFLTLKDLGVRIAIDDFGTGYSTMAYLRQLPIDILKIDRTFIAAMADTVESGALVRTFVQLGTALGLETVAEGIEETNQFTRLQLEACQSGQGYLFSRPLEPVAFEQYLVDCSTGSGDPAAPTMSIKHRQPAQSKR